MKDPNENRPGYKKTEVGWIPEEWDVLLLDRGCQIKHGYPFRGHLMTQRNYDDPIVICIGNYDYSGGFRFHSTTIRRYEGSYPSEFVLTPGSILLAMTCQTPGGEILGLPGIVPDDDNTYLHNQRLGLLVIEDQGRFDPLFLYYSFLSSRLNRFLFTSATGTKVKHTSPSTIAKYNLATPPLPEQKKITEILSTWDNSIKQMRKLIDAKKRRKKALMQQVLTGKKRLLKFKKPWNFHSLGELTSIVFSNVDKKTFPNEIPVRLCNYTDVYYNQKITENMPFMMASVTEREIQKYKLQKGDVIITKDSESPDDIAVPCYVAEELDDVVCGYHLAIIRPKKNLIHGSFLSQLLMTNGINYQFFRIANDVTRFGLTLESVKRITISIPRFDEQRCIAEILQAADGEIKQLEVKLKALEKQKRGLMQKLLTGEIRVTIEN